MKEVREKYPEYFPLIDKKTSIKSYGSLVAYLKDIKEPSDESLELIIWRIIIEKEECKKEVERLKKCLRSTTGQINLASPSSQERKL